MLAQEFKERGVAEIFFEVRAPVQIFRIDLGYRQTLAPKMPRKLQECDILFADWVHNPNRACARPREPHNGPPRSTELPLQRLHCLRRRVEALLEKLFQNFHVALSRIAKLASQSYPSTVCPQVLNRFPSSSNLSLAASPRQQTRACQVDGPGGGATVEARNANVERWSSPQSPNIPRPPEENVTQAQNVL